MTASGGNKYIIMYIRYEHDAGVYMSQRILAMQNWFTTEPHGQSSQTTCPC